MNFDEIVGEIIESSSSRVIFLHQCNQIAKFKVAHYQRLLLLARAAAHGGRG
jgi:hypothetical protein